jgi:hypothetical protein
MHRPKLADHLVRRNPFAFCNLLAASAERLFKASPIFGIQLVILVYQLKVHLRAFREINDILDDDPATLDATM